MERSIANVERKDRSLRLWGESGQLALESAHVCLLQATAAGTEVMKNIVLSGIGNFTIVDASPVAESDLGNSFFVEASSVGQPKCKVVTRMLLELNDEVSGHWVEEDPISLIDTRLEFFSSFSCVIACGLPENTTLALGAFLWQSNIPLFVAQCEGMIGYWRSVIPEVTIIESKPEFALEDYRLTHPFEGLRNFCESFHISKEMEPKEHSRIPAFVLLYHALNKYKGEHEGKLPVSSSEKNAFKAEIRNMAMFDHEENISEAIDLVTKTVFAFVKPEIPSQVKKLLEEMEQKPLMNNSKPFYLLLRALSLFVANEGEGFLPLTGSLPDMHCDTHTYLNLQRVYQEKAAEDVHAFTRHLHALSSSLGITDQIHPEKIKLFCKNAGHLRVIRTRSLDDEYQRPTSHEWAPFLELPEHASHHHYVLLRCLHRFRSRYVRNPAADSSNTDLARLKEICSELCTELGIPPSSIKEDGLHELCWGSGSEIHSIAAVIGGVGAQEVQKVLMAQFTPLNNTFIFNGVSGVNTIAEF